MDLPFFDREKEMRHLLLPLDQRRDWAVLIGPRKAGKTRLLRELQSRLPEPVLNVYLDLWKRSYDGPRLLRDLILALLDAAAANLPAFGGGGPAPTALAATEGDAALIAWLRTIAAKAGEAALANKIAGLFAALADPKRLESVAGAVIDLPEELARVAKRPVWIIWDEFQELENVKLGGRVEPFALLRSRWQDHKHVHYVVAGSRRSALERIAFDPQAPFFQHFDVVHVDQFSDTDGATFLRHAAKCLGHAISPALAEQAVKIVGGLPFHLQALAQDLAGRASKADRRALIACLDEQLHQPHGRLNLYFSKLYGETVRNATGIARVLDVLDEPKTLAEIARASGLPQTTVSSYLPRLMESGVIVRDAEKKIGVEDPAFALWLAKRRGSARGAATYHLGTDSERRVAEKLAELGFGDIYLARASRGAFDLVASYGAALLGVQVKRSKLPLRLSRAAVERMKSRAAELGWRARVAIDTGAELRIYDLASARRTSQGSVIDHKTQPLVTVRELVHGSKSRAATPSSAATRRRSASDRRRSPRP